MNAQMNTKDGERCPSSSAYVLHRLRTKQLLFSLLAISLLLLLPPRCSILESRPKIAQSSAVVQEPGDESPGMKGPLSSLVHRQQSSQHAVSCDLTKGKWVRDPSWPLYTAESCKPWLSQPWACSSSSSSSSSDGERDISYEHYRWQPQGCDLPEFDGQRFLRRMADKTIAFIGDSLGRQQYQSLMCILTSSNSSSPLQLVDETSTYNLGQAGTANRFLSTNTTVLYFWSSALCQLAPPEPSLNGSLPLHLDRVDSFLEDTIGKLDVLVVNTGHHWNRKKLQQNKWELHFGGKPVKLTRPKKRSLTVGQARRMAVTTVVAWLHEQVARRPGLKVFARTLSPRHFVGGEWDSGGKCDSTVRHALTSSSKHRSRGDVDVQDAVRAYTNVQVLDITELSESRGEAHVAKFMKSEGSQDCLHWCLPGVPDTWNHLLAAHLQAI